jgi:hypothetical protein
MQTLRGWITRLRPTPLGWVLAGLLVACIVLMVAASGGLQVVGFVGTVLLALMFLGTPRRAAGDRVQEKLQGLGPTEAQHRPAGPEAVEEAGEAAWVRERGRREGRL